MRIFAPSTIVTHIAVLIDVALLSGAAHGQMFQCPTPSVPVSGRRGMMRRCRDGSLASIYGCTTACRPRYAPRPSVRAPTSPEPARAARLRASRARTRLVRTGEAGPRGAGGATTGRALTPGAPARRRGDPHKAADQGNSKAQFGIGALYENCDGVERDYALALSW